MTGEDDAVRAARDALRKSADREAPADDPGQAGRKPRKSAGKVDVFARLTGAAEALTGWWNDALRPVSRFFNPVLKPVGGFYRWSWRTFAHRKDDSGERVLTQKRAGVTALALAAFTLAAPFVLVQTIIPTIARTIYDAGMLATMKEDQLYLGRAELIDPARGVYQVSGCRDIAGCDGGDNTTYYRLRDNIILDVQYWTTRFEPYDPAEIAGAMVSELNDCRISYYGRRSKALGWYPYIVKASCTPA